MEKYTLSLPQKLLTGCSIAIFVFGIGIILFMSISAYQDANRPITLASSSRPPVSGDGTELNQGLYFGEVAYQQSGYSQLSWGNNSVILFDGSSTKISESSIDIQSGVAFVIVSGRNNLTFKDKILEISNASGLFDANQNRFILFAGELVVSELETAQVNNVILHDGLKFTTANFDRSEFKTNPIWEEIISTLTERRLLPDALADTIPPLLELNGIEEGMSVSESLLKVTGITEAGATVTVNALSAVVNEAGEFSKDLILEPGNNRVIIESRDQAGNISTINTVITLTDPSQEEVSKYETDCNLDVLSSQLLCLVNEVRSDSFLSTLSSNTALETAAQNHSTWMADNLLLSHTQTNGSTYLERCEAVNITCIGEIIGLNDTSEITNLFMRWLENPEDEAVLLGESTALGVGQAQGYITLVFN